MHRENTIAIIGEIDAAYGAAIVRALDQIADRRPEIVTLVIDSPGGNWDWGNIIAATLDAMPVYTEGLVIGSAGSAAFTIMHHCNWRMGVSDEIFSYNR